MLARSHPRWLEPEKAKLLDEGGFRRDPRGDVYIAANGKRITEMQLLVHDNQSLERLIEQLKPRG